MDTENTATAQDANEEAEKPLAEATATSAEAEADGYYGEDDETEELDLSFLDEEDGDDKGKASSEK